MRRGFTLIELLIVMTIIAILAVAIIPNFVGFNEEAQVAATKSNLDTLRSRVTLFRAKEGRYPQSLDELVDKTYVDVGVRKPYLKKIPKELISSAHGSSDAATLSSGDSLKGGGGWVYYSDTADVVVNWNKPLDKRWGQYEGEVPSSW